MSADADHDQIIIPPGLLKGAAGLVALALVTAAISSWTGIGKTTLKLPPAAESRELRFVDTASGGIAVYDAAASHAFAILNPGEDGFVRSVLRGMAHERRINGLSRKAAFRLNRLADGRLSLDDLATGRTMSLEGFGTGNAESFARLLATSTSRSSGSDAP